MNKAYRGSMASFNTKGFGGSGNVSAAEPQTPS